MDFNHIYGHKTNIYFLKKAIENQQISHSYLFQGEESIGKKMLAFVFAKTLLCQRKGVEPCNTCKSCLKMDNYNHPDFTLIEPEKNNISMDRIKEFTQNIYISPLEGPRKIVVIDDAHKMRIETQNALLKTLEEPPSYLHIILIVPRNISILPTIKSRCEIIDFYPLNKDEINEFLHKKYGLDESSTNFLSRFTRGNIGMAIEMCESNDYLERREEVISIIDKSTKGDMLQVFSSKEFFNKNKEYIDEILDLFLSYFRDLLIYKEIGETDLLLNIDKIHLLKNQAFIDKEKIYSIIDSIEDSKLKLNRNANYQLTLETMLLNILEV